MLKNKHMEFLFSWSIQISQVSNEENFWKRLECTLRIRSALLFWSIVSHVSPTRFVANMNPRINNWPYRRIPLNYFLKICVFLDQQFLGVKTVSTEDSNFWCMIWVEKGFILFRTFSILLRMRTRFMQVIQINYCSSCVCMHGISLWTNPWIY